jgi:6-phosphogluconolactonase (cycloisomerase 2 family)
MKIVLEKGQNLFFTSDTHYNHSNICRATTNWTSADNLTGLMDTSGITELSGLHWNPQKSRLYAVQGSGKVWALNWNASTSSFSLLGSLNGIGNPEGITQDNFSLNSFFTVDENNYQIRKYAHNTAFSSVSLTHSWNLLIPPSPMQNTGNLGPEGIVFVPDSFLTASGFKSSVTGSPYVSVKGMGGLLFIANQDLGYVWVYDVNPNLDDDFEYVGKYLTGQDESCDLAFDRSTGLLYVLHNTNSNSLEVCSLDPVIISSTYALNQIKEYNIPNPTTNENIEGFAISPKCADTSNVFVFLCRDVESIESVSLQKDCLRFFTPFSAEGNCPSVIGLDETHFQKSKVVLFPVPATDEIKIQVKDMPDVLSAADAA